MNQYEFLFILKPDFSESEVNSVVGDVGTLLELTGGELVSDDAWGLRSLAYPIKKFNKGFYFVWQIALPGEGVSLLRKKLELNENILRFLLIRKD